MARQTRASAARAARPASAREARPSSRSPRCAGGGHARPASRPATERRWRRRARRAFVRESIGELKKVEWPTQNHLIQGTVVVIVACVIIGSYLYLCDQIFSKLVSKILLGQ